VQYAPTRGRHKVYIIDEAHMLSTSSFNALLKTLEEPPPRVIFILATTEPHRIPATIHSRCQRHDFRLLGAAEIIGRLREIVAAEGVAADEGSLAVLTQAATGSLRDAQSLLDQAIASLGNGLEAEGVAELLGLVKADVLAEAAEAILLRDAGRALLLVERLASHGQDLRQFALELSAHLRDLMILKLCPEPGSLLEGARVPQEISRRQAERTTVPELELMLKTLQQAEAEMRRAAQPRLLLEMALIRLAEIGRLQGLQEILERLVALEARPPGGPPAPESTTQLGLFGSPPSTRPPLQAPPPAPQPLQGARPLQQAVPGGAPSSAAAGWSATVGRLQGRKRLASVLAAVQSASVEEDRLTLDVANGNAFVRDTLEDQEARRLIADTAAQTFGRRLRLEYRFVASATPLPEPAETGAPAAPSDLREHPLVREALNLFGGSIIREART
jgi:DNA polymerase III subunit gamma/tau